VTTANLLADLRRDEGLRLTAYPDPLTHAAPWTIGYGHTGPEVHAGFTWTLAQAEAALAADVAHVEAGLDRELGWWRGLDDVRQDVLVNMAFNLGVEGLLKFHNTLAFVQHHAFERAAAGMQQSLWARQVGTRAKRLARQMSTGQHQA
jgi:lysozyme